MSELKSKCCGAKVNKYVTHIPVYRGHEAYKMADVEVFTEYFCDKCHKSTEVEEKKEKQ